VISSSAGTAISNQPGADDADSSHAGASIYWDAATMASMTRLPRDGPRAVQGELQRHGIRDQNLLEVLSKVVRDIETNMMKRVDQQDPRLKELSD
jgi:hypothetical protein